MNILAIDPALGTTGLAFQDKTTFVVEPPKKLKGAPRLIYLRGVMQGIVDVIKPDLVVVEDYSYGSRGTSLLYAGEWGGVFRVMLHETGLPVAFVSPSSLKQYCTSRGNAKKGLVTSELSSRSQRVFLTDDEADAWGLAAMAYDHYGEPWLKMPANYRKSLGGVQWPEIGKRSLDSQADVDAKVQALNTGRKKKK